MSRSDTTSTFRRRPPIRAVSALAASTLTALAALFVVVTPATAAIIQPFTQVFDQEVYGDFIIAGNGNVQCPVPTIPPSPFTTMPCAQGASRAVQSTDAINDFYSMRYVDVDSDAATYNSSRAQITIPAGSTVAFARLFWAGDTGVTNGAPGIVACSVNQASAGGPGTLPPGGLTPAATSLRVTVGAAATVNVPPSVFVSEPAPAANQPQYYGAQADVTALLAAAPTGVALPINVGNVWTPQGYNCFGGWSLTLVYKYDAPNATFAPNLREVYVYGGHVRQNSTDTPTTINVTGFRYPGGAVRSAVTAYEGDYGITGDQFTVNTAPAITEPFAGGANTNFFVSNADNRLNPSSPNNYSIDTKAFTIPNGKLAVGDTSANLILSTSGDSYLAQEIVFSVPVADLQVNKEVCNSTVAANCTGANPPGPWVKATTLPPGSTAYWRITVTNPSGVNINGVTLADVAEPSCAAAAGTFAVPAGQTRTFYCATAGLTGSKVNTVTASFVRPGSPPNTPATVTPPSSAQADVVAMTVNKEVCTSPTAADCATGGAGPWAKSTTVPVGASAFWRITATNTGSAPLVGVTLADVAEPTCVTAAGTFTLAVGESKQFYCATANLTAAKTNTVTATFPAQPGSPAGTPPTTTPPSTAMAEVYGLTVAKRVCDSTSATACAAGGAGPWVETATGPSGSTAYWRIDVSNTGTQPLVGVTLADPAEPSCVTAAGSFNLAVGQTRSFYCSTADVATNKTNTVTATSPPPAGAPPGAPPVTTPPDSASYQVYALNLAKEVCTSTTAADCSAGGAGPWAATTTVPLGATAYWRITATNAGQVPLTGITLADPTQPSCAAGPFNLAAGASAQFYCSSTGLTENKTNTVTASFLPPGSPDGTPPVTTPPATATANVFGLTLVKQVCQSASAGDCAPGGDGPWVTSVDRPAGTTAFWRITATNTGQVPLTGITLTDAAEPSCAATAGTFDLAGGEVRRFYCSTADVTENTTNRVTATFPPPGAPPNTPPITTPPASATYQVYAMTLVKEVCASTNAANCGADGIGPWAPSTTVQLGSNAYWRITATNTGDLPLTGITLTDAVEASCATAAMTFDLAVGATQRFYCATSSLTTNTTNTVTASYPPPPGAPPNTPPATTPPATATANVFGLTLLKEVCTSATAADCAPGGPGPWAPSTAGSLGSTAFWRITATNTGQVPLTGITLTDPAEPSCVAGPFDLAGGEVKRFYCSTADLTANKTNTVTASFVPPASPPGTPPVETPPSSATYQIYGMTLAKEVCTSTLAADCGPGGSGPWAPAATGAVGTTAYWRITATNTGGLPLTGVTLADAAEPSCVGSPFNLAAGASAQFYCSTSNVTASKVNTVTASFTPPGGPPTTTPPASARYDVYGLTLLKEVCASAIAADCAQDGTGPWQPAATGAVGTTAVWRITATNTGSLPLTGITLGDDAEPSCVIAAGVFDLAAGASRRIHCSTANVTVNKTNTATASFVPPGGPPTAPTATTPPTSAKYEVYALLLVKEVCTGASAADCGAGGAGPWAPVAIGAVGSTAYWRITATNTGSLPLTGITLADAAEPTCVSAAGAFDLAVGASAQFYCSTSNVTAQRVNAVTASFTPPGGPPTTTPPASARYDVYGLTLLKEVCTSPDAADCAEGGSGPWAASTSIPTGSTAYWRITVTNTGNLPLSNLTLADPVEPSCATAAGTFDLAAGASEQLFCSSSDLTAKTVNAVTASFTPPGGPPTTTPPATATANVYGLTILKEVCTSLAADDCGDGGPGPWAKTANLPAGSTAYWRITVTNTGNLPLTGITLTDPAEPTCVAAAGAFDLAAGASAQFYCSTDEVTADRVNTAAATFTPPGRPPTTTPPDTASVKITKLALVKEVCGWTVVADCGAGGAGPWAELAGGAVGATAYWRITVTNTGTVPLTGVTLADADQPSCVTAAGAFTLAVAEAKSFYCSTPGVTTIKENTATASYTPPGSPPGTPPQTTPPSTAVFTTSALYVEKEVCTSLAADDCGDGGAGPWAKQANIPTGTTAYWRITVTNVGAVPITGITLGDANEPSCVSAAGSFDLAVDEVKRFYCATDEVGEGRTNTVTASLVPPGSPPGTPPSTTPPSSAEVAVAGLRVVKEICASDSAADCGPGGVGPWTEQASLRYGGVAYWRIAVTNTGEVALSGVTLGDPAEPSCESAAGAFALAVGETVLVYCATPNVTQKRTNTVTASYVPPGSPPGTPPVVSPPDSATGTPKPPPTPPVPPKPKPKPPLPVTGFDAVPTLATGAALILIGAVLWLVARRRRGAL